MKILIAHAYAGVGHKKAADAVYKELSVRDGIEAKNVDILDYTRPFFRIYYPKIYLFLINRLPFLWGIFYYLLDMRVIDALIAPVRRLYHVFEARKFSEFVRSYSPDVVVCTHFMPAEVISVLKKKGFFKGKLITLITDFMAHSFWMAPNSDYFIGAIDSTRRDLIRRGVEEKKIKIFGIPCEPQFSEKKPKDELVGKIGIKDDRFNLLIMGGGFGTGPVREIVYSLLSGDDETVDNLQLIVVCGKNKKLCDELNGLGRYLRGELRVLGYSDNVDELMEISDCIVTKSGGLTVSESLSKQLPMIVIKPIPGQETRNCDILTRFGAAVRANSVSDVKKYVRDFITCPEKIVGMKARTGLLSYGDAVRNIADFMVKK